MSTQVTGARIESLTGVRIFAAAGVFLSHVAAPIAFPDFAKTFMASGYNGVTLFFMLSGFVLAWSWADRILPLNPRTFWSFAVARFARIYPLYLFTLAIFIAPLIASGKSEQLMFLHALALQPWSSSVARAYAFNGPAWSIGVELFLYACFPLVIFALSRIRRSTLALLGVGVAVIVAVFVLAWWFVATGRADLPWSDGSSAHRWLYRNPFTRLGDFVVGVIAAFIVQNCRAPAWMARCAQLVGLVTIIWLMCSPAVLFTAWSWDAAYMIPFALLLWGLASAPLTGFARALSTPKMVAAGEASFAFYLLHFPLINVVPLPTDNWFSWIVAAAILFCVIMISAVGAHAVIERPAQKWLRQTLDRKPQQKAPTSSTPIQNAAFSRTSASFAFRALPGARWEHYSQHKLLVSKIALRLRGRANRTYAPNRAADRVRPDLREWRSRRRQSER